MNNAIQTAGQLKSFHLKIWNLLIELFNISVSIFGKKLSLPILSCNYQSAF